MGGYWNYLTVAFVFVLEPLLDHLLGSEYKKLNEEEANNLLDSRFFDRVLYGWVFIQLGLLIWVVYVVSFGTLRFWYEWLGFVLSLGLITGGIGITVAHELGHRASHYEQFLSKLLLFTVGYMHFFIEHNRGHHKRVATPEDPATAREGENFYQFWLRSVSMGYLSAWNLENSRMEKKGKKRLSIKNQMIWFTIAPVIALLALFIIISLINGSPALNILWVLPAQAICAFTLLELVNYLEHYGLVRSARENGKYERVNPSHSWNADQRLSNFLLFELQRHSDHHAHASKPYQVLQHYDESPQLPMGYPTLVLLALVPPLWFHFMNPKLHQWRVRTSG